MALEYFYVNKIVEKQNPFVFLFWSLRISRWWEKNVIWSGVESENQCQSLRGSEESYERRQLIMVSIFNLNSSIFYNNEFYFPKQFMLSNESSAICSSVTVLHILEKFLCLKPLEITGKKLSNFSFFNQDWKCI